MKEKRMTEGAIVTDLEYAIENIEEAIAVVDIKNPHQAKEALSRALDFIQDALDVL